MKTKYVMNGGLAFSENKDIKKLEKLATEGWRLTDFALGGFVYKLERGPKQELTYTIDFQAKPDSEYFAIFSASGWQHIMSSGNQIHVFSAPKGTAPIYSGDEISEGKYQDISSSLGKGAVYSMLAIILLSAAQLLSKTHFEIMQYPLALALTISTVAFIFCFMPYLAYKYKEKTNR